MSESIGTSDHRWDKLSAALSRFHDLAWDRRNKATWLADALARSFTEYINIPVGRNLSGASEGIQPIKFYAYNAGHSPETDKFEPKDNSFDAIGLDAEGFHTFGIEIQLEMKPNTLPRYRFHWYVRARIDDIQWKCQVGVGNQNFFELTPPVKIEDLKPIVEATYTELLNWLELSGSGTSRQSRIGFSQE